MCTTPKVNEELGGPDEMLMVLPVKVTWAEISYYPGNSEDPTRKPPSPLAAPVLYCGYTVDVPPTPPPDNFLPPPPALPLPLDLQVGGIVKVRSIIPCDLASHPHVYANPFVSFYNAATQPGASQGTISVTPGIGAPPVAHNALGVKGPTDAYSYDVQLYPAWKLGAGYIGLPIVLEKSTVNGADLGSFTPAISYDLPFSGLWMRRPELGKR